MGLSIDGDRDKQYGAGYVASKRAKRVVPSVPMSPKF